MPQASPPGPAKERVRIDPVTTRLWASALAEALDEIAAFAFPARRGVGE
jgi:hypothetical protein